VADNETESDGLKPPDSDGEFEGARIADGAKSSDRDNESDFVATKGAAGQYSVSKCEMEIDRVMMFT
jgi:hypothetical protein